MERFDKQIITTDFMAANPRCFNHNDPGTGKTIATIDAFVKTGGKRLLVFAPLSILQASWGNDVEKVGGLSYAIAHGSKREAAMRSGAQVVITNIDAVNWIAKDLSLLTGFTHCVIDEYTGFKNRTSQRSKAALQIVRKIPGLWMLSGTPGSLGLCDMWFPALMVDGGARLGKAFWGYRSSVCEAIQNGPMPQHVEWRDRPEAIMMVADRLKDITIRYTLDECIDMPENFQTTIAMPMPAWLEKGYKELRDNSYLELGDTNVNAVHAGAKAKKILQLLSGAVYDTFGEPVKVHTDRYELILDLVEARQQCLVAYNWKHEIEGLKEVARRRGIMFGCINGDVSMNARTLLVQEFQAGNVKVIFAHPQSAGHGLTLTSGTTTIWCSPTHSAELWKQFNARIHRNGQVHRTETIRVGYEDSPEFGVYDHLDTKLDNMSELLNFMVEFRST